MTPIQPEVRKDVNIAHRLAEPGTVVRWKRKLRSGLVQTVPIWLPVLFSCADLQAQTDSSHVTHEQHVYKTAGGKRLRMYVTFPPDWKVSDSRPAMVFFFGGAWTDRYMGQFTHQANYFARRGMVTARADYRVKSTDGVTPDECVRDARSAVRWIRQHAAELGVDPGKLAVAGGSAGAHLAACQFINSSVDDAQDDVAVSTVPQAMVLYNPALDLTGDALRKRVQGNYELAKKISPTLHVDKDTPPAILFYGTKDFRLKLHGVPYSKQAKANGVRVEMFLAEGQTHGFFNQPPWRERTLIATDSFLASLGLLEGKP